MNIDPKSETPEQIAAKHSLKASGNRHDYNGSWVVDAMKEFAQSENQRLTKINEELVKALEACDRQLDFDRYHPEGKTRMIIKSALEKSQTPEL